MEKNSYSDFRRAARSQIIGATAPGSQEQNWNDSHMVRNAEHVQLILNLASNNGATEDILELLRDEIKEGSLPENIVR